MLCISQSVTDPYFNIASEEHLLKNFTEDIFMLYCNEPSIIVGKHQNTFGEINYNYVTEKDIKVVRRLSGGGTVFHDEGNLNFCFIKKGQEGNLIDFKKFTQPIIEVLQSLGVPAERSGRNDLIIKGLKFSGNAEHVYKNRTLHHGTLLFSSKLDDLREAIKVKLDSYQDKAVKSVRSKVTNITEHLPYPLDLKTFKESIINHVISQSDGATFYQFTENDIKEVNRLIAEKYSTWEWNFGYSPKFTFKNEKMIDTNLIEVNLEVEKGVIRMAEIRINHQVDYNVSQSLINQLYKDDKILKNFSSISTITPEALLSVLF